MPSKVGQKVDNLKSFAGSQTSKVTSFVNGKASEALTGLKEAFADGKAFINRANNNIKQIILPQGDLALPGGGRIPGGTHYLDDVADTGKNVSKIVGDGTEKGIPKKDYTKLRKKTPSQKIRDKVNPEGIKKDPVYDYEVDKLEADHIVSMKEITEMDGFNQLTFEEQVEILNLEDNFIGLGKSTNASKGANSWSDWKGHSKLGDVPNDVREKMLKLEAMAKESLKKAIQERLNR